MKIFALAIVFGLGIGVTSVFAADEQNSSTSAQGVSIRATSGGSESGGKLETIFKVSQSAQVGMSASSFISSAYNLGMPARNANGSTISFQPGGLDGKIAGNSNGLALAVSAGIGFGTFEASRFLSHKGKAGKIAATALNFVSAGFGGYALGHNIQARSEANNRLR